MVAGLVNSCRLWRWTHVRIGASDADVSQFEAENRATAALIMMKRHGTLNPRRPEVSQEVPGAKLKMKTTSLSLD